MNNPRVRQEIEKIIGFWLQLGVAGFRLDAAPFIIELTVPGDPSPRQDFSWLNDLHDQLAWRRGDAVILAEANVEPEQLIEYFGDGHRLPMLFNFILNQRTFLALARHEVGPILQALAETPALSDTCQWATFLRNHDEVDLGRLVGHEHDEVFAAFGPDPDMQLYGRGIRRRLAPMLGNDRRRIEMAYALQLSLPGTPVIRYGDEIGMGEDLTLPERNAIRTPMQWSDGPHAGFSTTRRKRDLRRPVIMGGDFGFETVNVEDQQRDPASLLGWFQRTLLILRECPEFGAGTCAYVDTGEPVSARPRPRRAERCDARRDQPRRRGVDHRPRSPGRAGRRPDRRLRRQRLPGSRSRPSRHRHRTLRISLDPATPKHRSPSRILHTALSRRHLTRAPRRAQAGSGCQSTLLLFTAYASVGTGPTLVKAANWLNHLDYDWESPMWRHWWRELSGRYQLVRYDERGCGRNGWEKAALRCPERPRAALELPATRVSG